jgi:hypothetical protein
MKGDTAFWICLLLIFLGYKDFGPPSERASVYLAQCSPKSPQGECVITGAEPETIFRAIAASQTVVTLDSGIVFRLDNCTVLDAKNWSCNTIGFPQRMVDGEYSAPWEKMSVRPVSWTHWLFLRSRALPAIAERWALDWNLLAWTMGLATLFAAVAVPGILFRRLAKRMPWLGAFLTGPSGGRKWAEAPGRAVVSVAIGAALILAGFSIMFGGAAIYDRFAAHLLAIR